MEGIRQDLGLVPPAYADDLCLDILKKETLGQAYMVQFETAVTLYFEGIWSACNEKCKLLLDITWEHLNTGHWKDVHISWRHAYSYLSLMKAVSEYAMSKTDKHGQPNSISDAIKTCDMGLLMGAPVMGNILTKLVSQLQGIHMRDQNVSNVSENLTPSSCARPLEETAPTQNVIPSEQDMNSTQKRNLEIQGDSVRPCKKKSGSSVWPVISPTCAIKEELCPSLERFRNLYMNTKTPVVINHAIDYWPALSARPWSLEYIKKVVGCRTVPIELGSKYTEEDWSQTLMTVEEFIERYIELKHGDSNVGYLAQHQLFDQIPDLQKDISVPTYCCLTDRSEEEDEEDVDINAWFGPAGTVSPLHHDPKHNLLAQVVGHKYIRLYAEEHSAAIYPNEDSILNNTSQVDVENPDLKHFPLFADAPYTEWVLSPGQMLYIPPRHWHYVRSLTVSFSVSFWWH